MAFCKDAKWVGAKGFYAPKFLKTFNIDGNIDTAVLSICGLGMFDLKVNGSYVSKDLLVPVVSDYEPRGKRRLAYPVAESLGGEDYSHRVYYLTYDIADYLKSGNNEITVILGNGWYNQRDRIIEGDLWYGDVKLCFDLEINSSIHVVSDESMLVTESYVIYNNIFFGEKHDFRIKDNYVAKTTLAEAPKGELNQQKCPGDAVHRKIHPRKIYSFGDRHIYDCGENISGWAVFTQQCDEGKETVIRYAEEIEQNGELNFVSAGGDEQIQTDVYISDGNKNLCRPHFTFHGFRYFEIKGAYDELFVEVVHTDVAVTADFECDNEILNKLWENYIRTQLSNMHCGIPSDCPQRERLGYTGDGQLTCDTAMHILDCKEFYIKWMQDIADGQNKKTGYVPYTVPFWGGGGGPGGWSCAIVMVPYFYYKNYGEKDILEKYYPNMLKWCDYMQNHLENGLVTSAEEGGWCLGEWGTPNSAKSQIPEPLVNTYFYIKAITYMHEIAEVISVNDDELQQRIEPLKQAMLDNYYDKDTNSVLGGLQGADLFFCDIGLGNEKMLQAINKKYDEYNGFDTGIFGTDILIRLLFQNGYTDTAVKLLSSCKERASFGYHIQKGATTLWEYWPGWGSHSHPMFGASVKYLITELMGMKKGKQVRIEPKISSLLSKAKAYITIDKKKVSEEYEIKNNVINFKLYSEQPAVFVWNNKEYELIEGTDETFSFEL